MMSGPESSNENHKPGGHASRIESKYDKTSYLEKETVNHI